MNNSYHEHPSEEALERFLLRMSPDVELETLETHILACGHCIEQLETLEIQIAATRLALRNWESRAPKKKTAGRLSRWRTWFTIPKLSFAGAGLTASFAALFTSIPSDVNLTAYRGTETSVVSQWRPLRMHLNAADLPPGPVAVELAAGDGSIVWRGVAKVSQDLVHVTLPRVAKSGPLFLRIYSETAADAQGALLREFAMRADWRK